MTSKTIKTQDDRELDLSTETICIECIHAVWREKQVTDKDGARRVHICRCTKLFEDVHQFTFISCDSFEPDSND